MCFRIKTFGLHDISTTLNSNAVLRGRNVGRVAEHACKPINIRTRWRVVDGGRETFALAKMERSSVNIWDAPGVLLTSVCARQLFTHYK